MQGINLPSKISFQKGEGDKSVVVIEPLYPGYGVTVGNALRRVLLSSLPGAAITSVKINGVDHEFSTVAKVREDVVDIILNLKKLRLKVHSEEPVKLELKAKGEKEVTAADIKPNSDVEIVSKDLHIATLDSPDASLSMELTAEQGRGYEPVEQRSTKSPEISTIAIDAVFSPLRNVNFEVENVRVGQITNYDRLTITMETDGTITGQEALDIASQILVDHFSFLKTDKIEAAPAEEGGAEEDEPPEAQETDREVEPAESGESEDSVLEIETLGLSNRSVNALKKNGIVTLAALRTLTEAELGRLEGLGDKSIEEILKKIKA